MLKNTFTSRCVITLQACLRNFVHQKKIGSGSIFCIFRIRNMHFDRKDEEYKKTEKTHVNFQTAMTFRVSKSVLCKMNKKILQYYSHDSINLCQWTVSFVADGTKWSSRYLFGTYWHLPSFISVILNEYWFLKVGLSIDLLMSSFFSLFCRFCSIKDKNLPSSVDSVICVLYVYHHLTWMSFFLLLNINAILKDVENQPCCWSTVTSIIYFLFFYQSQCGPATVGLPRFTKISSFVFSTINKLIQVGQHVNQ